MMNLNDNLPFPVDTTSQGTLFILFFKLSRSKYKGSVCNVIL